MSYRLNFIFLEQKKIISSVRVEVSKNISSKTIPPFTRMIELADLLADSEVNRSLIVLLNHSGTTKPPFVIPMEIFNTKACADILKCYEWLYMQAKIKGSIKKITFDKIKLLHKMSNVGDGHLVKGELFISDLDAWHKNIEARFVYDDAISPIILIKSNIPFISKKGKLYRRDFDAEELLLNSVQNYFNIDASSVSFPNADVKYLTLLHEKGWDIYITKGTTSRSKIFHHTASGIEWFSTNENYTDGDIANLLLDGFLKNRNYCMLNSFAAIFSKRDALQVDEKKIVNAFESSSNLLNVFSSIEELVPSDRKKIKSLLCKNVNAELRPYQQIGVEWLVTMDKNNLNCMLADDMGLGKTLQVLSFIAVSEKEKALIVAPTSLIQNWKNEILKFVPQLYERIEVVSYDLLRLHIDKYKSEKYDVLIVDEAQIIKNRNTKKFHSVKLLRADRIVSLTGTPIENSVDEIWSHFFILHPSMKRLHDKLKTECANSINCDTFAQLSGKLLNRFILRRTKDEVLKDLPPKIEKDVFVELSDSERCVYNQILDMTRAAFKQGLSGRINSLALESLLRLRQCCVSLNLLPSSIYNGKRILSSKLECALEYVKLFIESGSKVLIFSQFVSALTEMKKALDENSISSITLDGRTTNRSQIISEFEKNSSLKVFLISLKAGGVGLNLTVANKVILLDDWWNPAVENQAMSRAHRIGQIHPVSVIRLICSNTVEEKIVQLQVNKKMSSDLFLATKGKLSMKDFHQLLFESVNE